MVRVLINSFSSKQPSPFISKRLNTYTRLVIFCFFSANFNF